MLVCFLRSLVSHCPVFIPWLWSHWPLFSNSLPKEPSLALPLFQPVLPDILWGSQTLPFHLLG